MNRKLAMAMVAVISAAAMLSTAAFGQSEEAAEEDGYLWFIYKAVRSWSEQMDDRGNSDPDGDGIPNRLDFDDDNDGIADLRDALPFDPTESVDTDGDGIGNLADADDDNDGVEDDLDARPLDATGHEAPRAAPAGTFRFIGEHPSDRASYSLAGTGDLDCDGVNEIVIGAPTFIGSGAAGAETGAVYVVSTADLAAADAADGASDGVVFLGRIAAEPRSWKLVGTGLQYVGASVAPIGDINGDGCADLLVGARATNGFTGSVYLVSALDLPAADRADGSADGVVSIDALSRQHGSYEFHGENLVDGAGRRVVGVPDWDGDGFDEILIGASFFAGAGAQEREDARGSAYLLARKDLAAIDAEDGAVDGRISLASVKAGSGSWQIVGALGERTGFHLAAGKFHSDGGAYVAVGGFPGTLHLLARSDLPLLDAASGPADGVVELDGPVGESSWRLADARWYLWNFSAGDLDGNGADDLVVSGTIGEIEDGFLLPGAESVSYVIPASILEAADLADGVPDRTVSLAVANEQQGALAITNLGTQPLRIAVADVSGDGIADVVFGNENYSDGSNEYNCGTRNGVVYLVSGSRLIAHGASLSRIDLAALEPDGAGIWKFIGGVGDRLGYGTPALADLDRDGLADLMLGSYGTAKYYWRCGSRVGAGTAITVSGRALGNGETLLGSRVGDYTAIVERTLRVATTQVDDNLILMEVSGETGSLMRWSGASPYELAPKLYEAYEDAFDFLIFVRGHFLYCGLYTTVSSAIGGIGARLLDGSEFYGSAGRLKGAIQINAGCFDYNTLSHEIMHAWGQFVVRPYPHWGFTSANGILGGFDRENLIDLGDNRYAAGRFWTGGGDGPYSPLELYLAGLVSADEVPDLWVANDGQWTSDWDSQHGTIFTATDVEEWSMERIVARHGERNPMVADSQKAFRVATVVIADAEYPADPEALARYAAVLRAYMHTESDSDDETFNFHEVTGGRATVETGGLTAQRKPGAALRLAKTADALGNPGLVPRGHTTAFERTPAPAPHRFCGNVHEGHEAPLEAFTHGWRTADGSTPFGDVLDTPSHYESLLNAPVASVVLGGGSDLRRTSSSQ